MAQRPRIRTTPDSFLLEVPRLGPTARSIFGVIVFIALILLGLLDLSGYFGSEMPGVLATVLFFLGAFIVAARLLWLHLTTLRIEGDRDDMIVTLGPFSRKHSVPTNDLVLRLDYRTYRGTESSRTVPILVVEIGSKSYTRMVSRTRETIEQVVDEWEKWKAKGKIQK